MKKHVENPPDEIAKAIQWGAGILGIPCDDIRVEFAMDEYAENKAFLRGTKPFEIVLNMNPLAHLNRSNLTETIFHELTHIAQILLGRLQLKTGYMLWFGRPIMTPESHRAYLSLPYEVEARSYARELNRLYKLSLLGERRKFIAPNSSLKDT